MKTLVSICAVIISVILIVISQQNKKPIPEIKSQPETYMVAFNVIDLQTLEGIYPAIVSIADSTFISEIELIYKENEGLDFKWGKSIIPLEILVDKEHSIMVVYEDRRRLVKGELFFYPEVQGGFITIHNMKEVQEISQISFMFIK